MKGNGKKIALIIILFCAFSVGLFYLVTVTTKDSAAATAGETETVNDAEQTRRRIQKEQQQAKLHQNRWQQPRH